MLTYVKSTLVPVKILKAAAVTRLFLPRVGQMSIHNKKLNALKLLT